MVEEKDTSDFETWLAGELDNLEVDSQVFGGYVAGTMGDDSSSLEERIQYSCDTISGATDKNLDTFRSDLKRNWEATERNREQRETEKAAIPTKMIVISEEERRQVEDADAARLVKVKKEIQRSEEEQRERARLLGQYGYDSDPVDEDGNPLPPQDVGGEDSKGARDPWDDLGKNTNRESAAQERAAKRREVAAKHAAVTLRDKMALQADRTKKEMAEKARKAPKGERRSGRG